MPESAPVQRVWDGDWAILEEYDSTGSVVQKYVQGYHGLVKTLVDNIYYYQDELGSTSHIASSAGALIESYQYDLYGKPTYFSSTSQSLNSSTYGVKDLFTGQRWVPELGLYDDRNRFMSPDLGRFLQPDPIGFKGDSSNLYRYCGNDWANRTDPMGLSGDPQADKAHMENEQQEQHMDASQQVAAMELRNCAYAPTANQVERSGGNSTYNIGNGQTLKVQGSTWYKGASYSVGTLSPGMQHSATQAQKQQLKFTTLSPTKNSWVIRWGLTHSSTNGGWIVQHIQADFKSAGKFDYWEAWQVSANSRFATTFGKYGYDDMFSGPTGSQVSASLCGQPLASGVPTIL